MKKIAFLFVLLIITVTVAAQENIAVFLYSTHQLSEPTAALRSSIVGALVNCSESKYKVVDRSDEFMKSLGMELEHEEKGYVSNKQLTTVGEQLGAQKVCNIVITDYGRDGGGYQIDCSIIDVKTGAVDAHAVYPIGEDDFVYQLNIVNSRKVAQSLAQQLELLPEKHNAIPERRKKSILPTFEFKGATYMVAPDPGYAMKYQDANPYCANLTLEGHSDWILPSREQIVIMYTLRKTIGGFEDSWYWINAYETSPVYPNKISFLDGEIAAERDPRGRVRPIRKIQRNE